MPEQVQPQPDIDAIKAEATRLAKERFDTNEQVKNKTADVFFAQADVDFNQKKFDSYDRRYDREHESSHPLSKALDQDRINKSINLTGKPVGILRSAQNDLLDAQEASDGASWRALDHYQTGDNRDAYQEMAAEENKAYDEAAKPQPPPGKTLSG